MNILLKNTITTSTELKNPMLVYGVINNFMNLVGEDFIDCNELLVNGKDMLNWLLDKSHINQFEYETLKNNLESDYIQELLQDTTGIFGEDLGCYLCDPKAYQLLSQYISDNEELITDFYNKFCSPLWLINHHEPINYVDNIDFSENTITDENLHKKFLGEINVGYYSLTDEYNFLKNMTIDSVKKMCK